MKTQAKVGDTTGKDSRLKEGYRVTQRTGEIEGEKIVKRRRRGRGNAKEMMYGVEEKTMTRREKKRSQQAQQRSSGPWWMLCNGVQADKCHPQRWYGVTYTR